jgi:hypothetical protein
VITVRRATTTEPSPKEVMIETHFPCTAQMMSHSIVFKLTDGLAMGAPTSSIIAETYIQHMEHTQIYPILIQQQIIAYYRYVDDILIIFDQNKTNINHTHEFNKLQLTIKFTIEK